MLLANKELMSSGMVKNSYRLWAQFDTITSFDCRCPVMFWAITYFVRCVSSNSFSSRGHNYTHPTSTSIYFNSNRTTNRTGSQFVCRSISAGSLSRILPAFEFFSGRSSPSALAFLVDEHVNSWRHNSEAFRL